MYSAVTMEHFRSPRRVGVVTAADGAASGRNPVCGDLAEMTVRFEGQRLAEVRFRAQGCPAVVAACSLLCELVEGLPLREALAFDADQLVLRLGGLPPGKKHGAKLAVKVLRDALGAAEERSGDPVNMKEAQGAPNAVCEPRGKVV